MLIHQIKNQNLLEIMLEQNQLVMVMVQNEIIKHLRCEMIMFLVLKKKNLTDQWMIMFYLLNLHLMQMLLQIVQVQEQQADQNGVLQQVLIQIHHFLLI